MFKKCFKIGICANICHKIKYRCNSSSLVTRSKNPVHECGRDFDFLPLHAYLIFAHKGKNKGKYITVEYKFAEQPSNIKAF